MPCLSKSQVSEILNLKSSSLISDAVANRQKEVIRRGFNHLSQEENNVLYIADEVGLGKTYIAIGIASLLRHFSEHPGSYQDVIIVPKENLQYKWEKEIKQFIGHNYKLSDNRVKSIIGAPVGEIIQKHYLSPIDTDHPAYHLYRNSQFSFGLVSNEESKKEQFERLKSRISNPFALDILERALSKGYFLNGYKSFLKKLYAYLLCLCNPRLELVIVDEGHNYKYGLGYDNDDVADRNNVISRFFGLKGKTEEDRILLNDFPELKELVKPRIQKLIILSATPKTESLIELKNQIDCFLPNHILTGLKNEEEIKNKLPYFLIRGNMEYRIGDKNYTRNLCRLEHRKGNAFKEPDALPLEIKDDEQAIVMGLLQYNTIKYLGTKNNASFELGMLAGFETFRLDQERASNNLEKPRDSNSQEYEEVRSRKNRVSQDATVLGEIIESYKTKFGSLPPHPKQDAIVEGVFRLMMQGEKSLIFVRRVASANELERRLLDKWEEVIHHELSGKWNKLLPSKPLQQLLNGYREYKENRDLAENLEDIFRRLTTKLLSSTDFGFEFFKPNYERSEQNILVGLYFLYNNHKDVPDIEEWYKILAIHSSLIIIKTELVQLSYELMERYWDAWKDAIEVNEAGEIDEVTDAYYFHNYFSQSHAKPFKNRLYSTDWFDVNYFRLNNHFSISSFRIEALTSENIHAKDKNDLKEIQEVFLKNVLEEEFSQKFIDPELYPSVLITKTTLFTEIIIQCCDPEFRAFIERISHKKKSEIFAEVKVLFSIIKGCLRNGAGFLPLFIADKAEGDMVKNYLSIILDKESIFNLIASEIRLVINDYALIRAVNFPEGESNRQLESKLFYQSPVIGLTGQSTRLKSNVAAQFRMPGFPFILVTTDIFREGEDLHTYCQNIYHYGIAWNCSDMEQRTGRVDRINSSSHRKMEKNERVEFEEKVHVFYPYIKQTLEVNQVGKLFSSINSFVETFNDFTDVIKEDPIASTSTAMEDLPQIIEKPFHSKFEHTYFKGCDLENNEGLELFPCIGMQLEELQAFLIELEKDILAGQSFHYGPELDLQAFTITGDFNLIERDQRRGPFIIKIYNDIVPGKFSIEASSHLFKISSRIQKPLKEMVEQYSHFTLGSIDDIYALSFTIKIDEYSRETFKKQLFNLVTIADEIEDKLMRGDDMNYFGKDN